MSVIAFWVIVAVIAALPFAAAFYLAGDPAGREDAACREQMIGAVRDLNDREAAQPRHDDERYAVLAFETVAEETGVTAPIPVAAIRAWAMNLDQLTEEAIWRTEMAARMKDEGADPYETDQAEMAAQAAWDDLEAAEAALRRGATT